MRPPIPGRPALFVDVDGTLLPIAARPADARPEPSLLEQLGRLQSALDGALALLSGRPLDSVTRMFQPLALPAAGTHGLERRRADGRTVRTTIDDVCLDEARRLLSDLVAQEPRLTLEDKGEAFAVHYRTLPEHAAGLGRELQSIAEHLGPRFHIQPGYYVYELKPALPNKGSALLDFMGEEPFLDRIAIAIGDDLTDLHAFRAATACGGFGIAVGNRVRSRWHFPDPASLREWLDAVISKVDG